MSWTEIISSGGPSTANLRWCLDTARNEIYVLREGDDTAIYRWDGTTLTTVTRPNFGTPDTCYGIDYDATNDRIYVSGGSSAGVTSAWTAQAAAPLGASPTWTLNNDQNRGYCRNQIYYPYGGENLLMFSTGSQSGWETTFWRKANISDAETSIFQLANASTSRGVGSMVKVADNFVLAGSMYVQGAKWRTYWAALTNTPSDQVVASVYLKDTNIDENGATLYFPQIMPWNDGTTDVGVISLYNGTDSDIISVKYESNAVTQARAIQTISGKKLLTGTSMDNSGYLVATDGTLYSSSDVTGNFVDASDPVPVGGASVRGLTPIHTGTGGMIAWLSDGSAYQKVSQVGVPQLLAFGG